jgi:two-component system NarL family response regulator
VRSAPGRGTKVLLTAPRLPSSTAQAALREADSLRGVRILLADDSPLFLDGLRSLLLSRGLTVAGLAHDGQQALEMARLLRPDIILMDIRMPRCDGVEAVRLVKAELPETKIIMLTASEDDEHLFETIRNGASGYLLKSLEANALVEILAGAMRGEAAFSPGLAARLLQEFGQIKTSGGRTRFSDSALSGTQCRLLDLVADGKQYKEVAVELGLSVPTVKYHMGKILERLHLENRAQAVEYAKRLRK